MDPATWAFVTALVGLVCGGGGYLVRRRIERRKEHEALNLDQVRVKLLTEVTGLMEKMDASARDRTSPAVTSLIESTLKTLSAAAPKALSPAEKLQEAEERRKRERLEHQERMRKIREDSDRSSREYEQKMIDLYRRPLEHNALALCIYAVRTAQLHAGAHDLKGFNEDWEVFKTAAHDWLMASDEDQKEKAKAVISEMDKRLRAMLDALGKALKPPVEAKSAPAQLAAPRSDVPPAPPADPDPGSNAQ